MVPSGPDLCYCLASRRSARHLTRLYERHLAQAGLTSAQFSILSILERDRSMTMAELARFMAMERTSLLRTLKPLKDQGLVVDGDEKVGRAVTLHLSPAGLAKTQEGLPLWEAAQAEFEASVGQEAAALFRNARSFAEPVAEPQPPAAP